MDGTACVCCAALGNARQPVWGACGRCCGAVCAEHLFSVSTSAGVGWPGTNVRIDHRREPPTPVSFGDRFDRLLGVLDDELGPAADRCLMGLGLRGGTWDQSIHGDLQRLSRWDKTWPSQLVCVMCRWTDFCDHLEADVHRFQTRRNEMAHKIIDAVDSGEASAIVRALSGRLGDGLPMLDPYFASAFDPAGRAWWTPQLLSEHIQNAWRHLAQQLARDHTNGRIGTASQTLVVSKLVRSRRISLVGEERCVLLFSEVRGAKEPSERKPWIAVLADGRTASVPHTVYPLGATVQKGATYAVEAGASPRLSSYKHRGHRSEVSIYGKLADAVLVEPPKFPETQSICGWLAAGAGSVIGTA